MPGVKLPQIVPAEARRSTCSEIANQPGAGSAAAAARSSTTPTQPHSHTRGRVLTPPNHDHSRCGPYDLPAPAYIEICHQHGFDLKLSLWRNKRTQVCFARILDSKIQQNHKIKRYVMDLGHGYCAVKIIDKSQLSGKTDLRMLQREMLVHHQLNGHPHIVTLFEYFQCPANFYIVLEFCPSGDLVEHINRASRWTGHGLPEPKARLLFLQLLSAIQFCHGKGIAHRDIKLENVLLDEHGQVKLADFGFARNFQEGPRPKTPCGSRPYAAPELLFRKTGSSSKSYDAKATDVWSLGVILHAMVTGRLPFDVTMDAVYLQDDMQRQRLQFLDGVSKEAESLIRGMLQFSPRRRLSLSILLQMTWIKADDGRSSTALRSALLSDTASNTAMRNYAMRTFSTVPVGLGLERIRLKSRGGRPEVHGAWERSPFRTGRYALEEEAQRKRCRAAAEQARHTVQQAQQQTQQKAYSYSGMAGKPRAVTADAWCRRFSSRSGTIPAAPHSSDEDIYKVAAANQGHLKRNIVVELPLAQAASSNGIGNLPRVSDLATQSAPFKVVTNSSAEMSIRCKASSSSDLFKQVSKPLSKSQVHSCGQLLASSTTTTMPLSTKKQTMVLQPEQTTAKVNDVSKETDLKKAAPTSSAIADRNVQSERSSILLTPGFTLMADDLLSISKVTLREHSLLYVGSKPPQQAVSTSEATHSVEEMTQPQPAAVGPARPETECKDAGPATRTSADLQFRYIPQPPPGNVVSKAVPAMNTARRTYVVSTMNPSDFFDPRKHEL